MDPGSWDPYCAAGGACDPLMLREIFNADQACPLAAVAPLRLMRHKRRRHPRHTPLHRGTMQVRAAECKGSSGQLRPLVMVQVPASAISSPGGLSTDCSHQSLVSAATAITQHAGALGSSKRAVSTQPMQQQLLAQTAAQACSSSTSAAGAGSCVALQGGDDLAAQKAAAQAAFLQQQQQQSMDLGQPACHSKAAELQGALKAEQARASHQQGLMHPRLLWSLLLCNVLCCVLVVAAKTLAAGGTLSASVLQWPMLVLLLGSLSVPFHCWLRPLQFRHAALEQQFTASSQSSWQLVLDVLYSLAGCAGMAAAVRSIAAEPGSVAYARFAHHAAGPSLQQPLQQVLSGGLVMGSQLLTLGLMLVAPRTYQLWRERLLLVAKSATVLGVMTLVVTQSCNNNSISSGGAYASLAAQQPWPLPHLGQQQLAPQLQAAGSMLASGCVHAFLLASLSMRVSAFVPLQLLHVVALLLLAAASGSSSGSSLALCALLLLAVGMWVPVWLLAGLETSARRAFLQQQQLLQAHGFCSSCKVAQQ